MNISFVGLGAMGHPMARNLLHAHLPLQVWNRTPSRADDLVASGATRARTMSDLARADIVITMVADDGALEHVVFHERLIELLPAGAIHVSMSTISVALAERLATAHEEHGTTLVSAPVMGRPEAAAAAKLLIFAAGPQAALEKCQPVFDVLGQRTFHVGSNPAAANTMKLSANFLIAVVIESLAESMALARKSGIDPHLFLDLLTSTLFTAPIYKTYGGLIAEERYRPAGFRLPLGLKDVSLALAAARAVNVPLPLASLIRDHLIAALAQGYGDADWSALGALAAKNAGL